MRAVSDGSKAVERRNSDRRSEIAVGGSAGGAFVEFDSDFFSDFARYFKKTSRIRVAFHGRTIDSSANLQGRASEARLQSTDRLCDSRRFFVAGDSDIDVHSGLGGHNIHASSTLYQSNGNGCAATWIGQALKPEHLMSDLLNRVDAAFADRYLRGLRDPPP